MVSERKRNIYEIKSMVFVNDAERNFCCTKSILEAECTYTFYFSYVFICQLSIEVNLDIFNVILNEKYEYEDRNI